MSDLTEFLLARVVEDEVTAREAAETASGQARWYVDETWGYGYLMGVVLLGGGQRRLCRGDDADRPVFDHIARFDPARVLAECEAKRAIVEAWALADRDAGAYPGTDAGIEMGLCDAIRHLAAVYADHSEYDEAWRP